MPAGQTYHRESASDAQRNCSVLLPQSRGVQSARPVGYNVGKAIAKIRSLLDASSIGVMRIDCDGRLGGEGYRPVIPWTIMPEGGATEGTTGARINNNKKFYLKRL